MHVMTPPWPFPPEQQQQRKSPWNWWRAEGKWPFIYFLDEWVLSILHLYSLEPGSTLCEWVKLKYGLRKCTRTRTRSFYGRQAPLTTRGYQTLLRPKMRAMQGLSSTFEWRRTNELIRERKHTHILSCWMQMSRRKNSICKRNVYSSECFLINLSPLHAVRFSWFSRSWATGKK